MSNTRRRRVFNPCSRIEHLETRSLLSVAGTLDTSFGAGQGYVQPDPGIPLVEPDGKILVAGVTAATSTSTPSAVTDPLPPIFSNFELQQLNADGSTDTTYGQAGKIITSSGLGIDLQLVSAALQSDGKVVIVAVSSGLTDDESVYVARLDTDGTLDTTFGTNGIESLPGPSGVSGNSPFIPSNGAIAIQSDGRIVLAGYAIDQPTSTTSGNEFAAVRLNPNGTIDTSFGTDGEVVVPFPDSEENGTPISVAEANSVAIEPNGLIVLAGTATVATPSTTTGGITQFADHFAAVRLSTDGSLDTSFGGTAAAGLVILPLVTSSESLANVYASSVALQTDGKIVLGGSSDSGQFVVDRLNADGTVDTTFANGGESVVPIPMGIIETTGSLVIQASGEIALSGRLSNPQGPAIARFTPDGTPDPIFSNTTTAGLVIFSQFNNTAVHGPTVLANLPNGNLLFATGESGLDSTTPLDLASVLAPPPALLQPPADYDGSGKTNLAVYLPSVASFAYRPTNGTADVIEAFGIAGAGETIPAPGDYTGAGKTEIAAYLSAYGVYAIRPAGGGPDVIVPFGIPGAGQSIPVPGDYFGTGVDDIAVYMPSIASYGIRNPAGGPDEIISFGITGAGQSIPAPGDYFGTGQTDLAVYLPSIGAFAIRNPAGGPDEIIPFGISGAGNSIPIPGDYDGSGKTELAVYLPKLGEFAYRPADGGPDVIVPFGTAGDGSIPVPGDYDGSGKTEIAIYDPNYASFAYRPADGGPDVIQQFGVAGVGASLPAAAPVSSNVPAPSSSTVSAKSVGSTTVSSTSAMAISKAVAVPGGPMALAAKSLVRIATTLPAQADPSKSAT